MSNKNKKLDKRIFILAEAVLVIACGIWYSDYKSKNEKVNVYASKNENFFEENLFYKESEKSPKDIVSNEESSYFDEDGRIIRVDVEISGAVNNPGVYKLNTDNTFGEAVNAAGGLSKNADVSEFNAEHLIFDAIKIYIPQKGEDYKGEFVTYEDDGIVSLNSDYEYTNNGNCVNINIASVEELKGLYGIGEKTAEAIVKYRNKNGEFKSIDEFKKVFKIKDSIFDKIKYEITI